ncbi:annexin-B12-like [Diadema antillarum]|uniref:annexin-B12-like n=1 Tax=Diadema antillarum TaxID=105358 RepID=UPI003A8A92ED
MAAVEEGGKQIMPADQPPCPVRTRPAIVCRDFLSRGTVQPADPFNVEKDVEDLHKAFKGSDDKSITSILSRRTNEQRQLIAKSYEAKYSTSLLAEMKSDLSVQYRKTISGLMEKPDVFLAKHVHNTLQNPSLAHKDVALLEMLYPLEPQEVEAITKAYKEEFKHSLEEEVEKQTKGLFKAILLRLITGQRSTQRKVDVPQRNKDLEYLRNNTQERLQSGDEEVIRIFGNSSLPQLSSIFLNFDKAGGCTLQEYIQQSNLDNHTKEGFKVMVKSVYNRTGFYADQLHMAIKDIGCKEDSRLMRIVISRSEIDLENIKDFFQSAYSHTVTDLVYDDTSGDYRDLLLRLVGM